MKIVTFGTSGIYPKLSTAWSSAVWDDDIHFIQVGVVDQSADNSILTDVDQLGHSAWISGNGDTFTFKNVFVDFINPSTGNVLIEGLNAVSSNDSGDVIFGLDSDASSDYTFEIRYNRFITSNSLYEFFVFGRWSGYCKGWSKILIYGNYAEFEEGGFIGSSSSNSDCLLSNTIIRVEDNMFIITGDNVDFATIPPGATYDGKIYANRNYFSILGEQGTSVMFSEGSLAEIIDSNSDNFTNLNDPSLDTGHYNIAFSTANFESVTYGDNDFGIPKIGTALITEASQGTEISGNLTGINGIIPSVYSAGPFAIGEPNTTTIFSEQATIANNLSTQFTLSEYTTISGAGSGSEFTDPVEVTSNVTYQIQATDRYIYDGDETTLFVSVTPLF